MDKCRGELRDEYVMVRADVDDKETEAAQPVELPTEDDSTLLLTVLQSQFEGATGLKYRNPNTGLWRGVRISNGVLHPPSLSDGWGNRTYVVVCPKKHDGTMQWSCCQQHGKEATTCVQNANGHHRPVKLGKRNREKEEVEEDGDEEEKGGNAKEFDIEKPDDEKSSHASHCSPSPSILSEDLIVLGLSYSVTEKEFKDYFSKFGELAHAELKIDSNTNKSRGFGFIRYKDPHAHWNVFTLIHTINGRRCELKRPRKTPVCLPSKFFVGCLPMDPEATTEELRRYFIKYGPLSDVYIPRPYRGFGFVTFTDGEDGQKMMGFHHSLRGCALNITLAEPRGTRISQSQLHGCSYSGAGSFSIDSRMPYGLEPYTGTISQHIGHGFVNEYGSLMLDHRSVLGGSNPPQQLLYDL